MMRKLLWVGILATVLATLGVFQPSALAQQAEIHLWTFIDPAGKGPRQDALKYIVQTFEAKNPGVKVVAEVQAWNQIGPSLLRALRVSDWTLLCTPWVCRFMMGFNRLSEG